MAMGPVFAELVEKAFKCGAKGGRQGVYSSDPDLPDGRQGKKKVRTENGRNGRFHGIHGDLPLSLDIF